MLYHHIKHVIRLTAGSILSVCLCSAYANNSTLHSTIPQLALPGKYAVGTKIVFIHNHLERFDPWGATYTDKQYRNTLQKISASGQPRTIIASIWYPAVPKKNASQQGVKPLVAASGKQATYADYVLDNKLAQPYLVRMLSGKVVTAQGESVARLIKEGDKKIKNELTHAILARKRDAYINAQPASGHFPVVVLLHGLEGNYITWNSTAEFLASNGYFVIAPIFPSDGSLPLFFNDPSSEFAKTHSRQVINDTYRVLFNEKKVVPFFYQFLFGMKVNNVFNIHKIPFNPEKDSAIPGGAAKATAMMRNLFRQRLQDVTTLVHTIDVLNENKTSCEDGFNQQDSIRGLCGVFSGKLDTHDIGVAGHSLGSMTAQLALATIPAIKAAVGLNNAPPYTWTPPTTFGDEVTKNGEPVGNHKPVLQLIGNEDKFVQSIFYGLFQGEFVKAGGKAASVFPLSAERVKPSITNPQPVALSKYQRDTGPKALITVGDVNHASFVDDYAFFPPYGSKVHSPFYVNTTQHRKGLGNNATNVHYQGKAFKLLGWKNEPGIGPVFIPDIVRDYYMNLWFSTYLKGDTKLKTQITQNTLKKLASIHIRTNLQHKASKHT